MDYVPTIFSLPQGNAYSENKESTTSSMKTAREERCLRRWHLAMEVIQNEDTNHTICNETMPTEQPEQDCDRTNEMVW